MNTLFLRADTWDLALDVNNNIAIASDAYATTQDVASACRVFIGDIYFNQTQGIPYFEEILGSTGYSLSLYRDHLEQQALSVPEVRTAKAIISTSNQRIVIGRIEITKENGSTGSVNL